MPGALGNGPKTLGNCFAECNTRHTTHDIFLSANSYLPSVFCRALGKAFAECRKSTRQRFTLGKIKMRKNPKIIAKIFNFFSGEAATDQRPPVSVEVAACLFEALNEFKSKSGELQSFVTFRDLQFSFRKFFHPRSFEKFEFQI